MRIYPKANVWHSLSLRHKFSQILSEFVSENLNVFSKGNMDPSAILSKQSKKKRIFCWLLIVKDCTKLLYISSTLNNSFKRCNSIDVT